MPDSGVVSEPAAPSRGARDRIGTVGKVIGTGKHAKTTIAFLAMKYAFIAGFATFVLILVGAYFGLYELSISELVSVWAIFLPIASAALGYLFGKEHSD